MTDKLVINLSLVEEAKKCVDYARLAARVRAYEDDLVVRLLSDKGAK